MDSKFSSISSSEMEPVLLLRRYSSRWRAAADVGTAVSGRDGAPHDINAESTIAVRLAPDIFLRAHAR